VGKKAAGEVSRTSRSFTGHAKPRHTVCALGAMALTFYRKAVSERRYSIFQVVPFFAAKPDIDPVPPR
jgi:hypothetical protein